MSDIDLTSVKGYWKRPEGKFGMLLIGAAGAAGFYFFNIVLAFLLSVMLNGFAVAALVAAAFAFYSLLTSKKFWILFKGITFAITGMIIDLNPVNTLRACVAAAEGYLHELDERMKAVYGVRSQFVQRLAQYKQRQEELLRKASYAKKKGDAREARINATLAHKRGEATLTYEALAKRLEMVFNLLKRMREICDEKIQYMRENVELAADKQEAYKTFTAAIRSIGKILRGNGDVMQMYDLATERLAYQEQRALGEIEEFATFSERFISNVDLENGAIESTALTELENWEKRLSSSEATLGGDVGIKSLIAEHATQQAGNAYAELLQSN